ncbi:MAG: hypothetical protein H6Q23_2099, partial [Bacteroidetes bacterium]|nr:hypothetical protein [Bacteroidota bacterium]
LKGELQKETLIEGITAARSNPVRIGSNSGGASWEGKDPERRVLIGTNAVDYDYLETMKMELKSGRGFSKEYISDLAKDTTGNFLVNEEVAKIIGVDDPVGMSFIAFALTEPTWLSFILIRLSANNIPESLKAVEKVWARTIPEYPFDYFFIDEDYNNIFRTQVRLTKLLKYFTILAVIIACLGLYGLSAYSAERRTNEIGIRKVMGAGWMTIQYLMIKEFLILVVISLVIAIPAGWIIVRNLLEQFASRIDIKLMVFIIIAVCALIIALITVSFQAFMASRINPAEALKIE